MRRARLCLASIPVWVIGLASGQSFVLKAGLNTETGSFVFQHYSAKQYGASPQNWATAQDSRGIMYFGNTEGVLEYDGVAWRLIPLPGVRSVSVAPDGTIYVGGRGTFGVLRPDSTGTMAFVSLIDRVPAQERQFADVWRILPSPEGVYFSAYSRLFRLNRDGTVKVWKAEKKFGKAFHVLGDLYVNSAGKGLLKMSGDLLAPVPGGDRFADKVIEAAVQLENGALIATAADLFRMGPDGVTPFASAAAPYFSTSFIYSMQLLPGGQLAVGTRKGGLVLLNAADGAPERIITKADGLADDLVGSILVDRQGGVWLTGNDGLTRFNPGLSSFPKGDAIRGDVQCMARQGNTMYAGTTEGLFRMLPAAGAKPQFERVNGISHTVWALAPYEEHLLAATEDGAYVVSGNSAVKVESGGKPYFWDVTMSLRDSGTAYTAGRTGVFAFQRHNSTWEKTAEFVPPSEEFRSVLEDTDGRVWATTRDNIWRFDFRETPVKSEKFGPAQGVPGGWANVRRLQGHTVFATTKGLRRYSDDMKRFVPDVSLGAEFANGARDVFNVFDDPAGNVWVTGKGYHKLLLRQAQGYKPVPAPLQRAGIEEIYWMSLDGDGTAWVTGADFVLYRWDRALSGDPDKDFHVLTRRVEVIGDKAGLYGGAGSFPAARLPWSANALRFEFAAPFYEEPASVEYRFQLENSDSAWSPWSHETQRPYTHLPEGSYRFKVQARTPHGATSEDGTIAFSILPPWYRSWWAYTLYAIFGGFGVWSIVRLRTRKLIQEKHQLEAIVEERTVEIREQRDEIQVQEQKSQALLLNILPATVADELKATGAVQPVGFDDVTVCFTDFVGFTLSSEKLAPGKLVDSLNEYFTAFDEIIARYGLEKLKTIGDSYMFVSGLPVTRKSHAVDAVLAALEMVQIVKDLAMKPDGTAWGIRVGLHSGPVVAGVVGIRKFAFDIWGNTVNFAARMESSGVPGNVNMSERTCGLLKGLIDTQARGNVKIKEGRELPMFLARGPAIVSEEAFARRYEQEFGEPLKSFPAGVADHAAAVWS